MESKGYGHSWVGGGQGPTLNASLSVACRLLGRRVCVSSLCVCCLSPGHRCLCRVSADLSSQGGLEGRLGPGPLVLGVRHQHWSASATDRHSSLAGLSGLGSVLDSSTAGFCSVSC